MFEKEKEILKSLSNYYIEIGVISEKTGRKDDKISVGITNAELMYIHENGSPSRNIPSRPILDITIRWAEKNLMPKTLNKIIDGIIYQGWSSSDVEKELNKMCIRMQNYAYESIYDNNGILAPNSQEVAARKKGNHPLFDTGQLARSITCRLVNKKLTTSRLVNKNLTK